MSRLGTQLSGTALAISVVAFFLSLMDGDPGLVAFFAVAALGLSLLVWRARRADTTERPWSTASSDVAGFAGRPRRGSTGQVSWALGRVEGREVLLSPWLAVGVGFCAVMVVSFASSYDAGETWGNIVQDLPFLAHPLVGMMVLVGHRLGTRAARDGAAELFVSCPTAARTRTLGILSAAWVPPVLSAVFFAGYLAVGAVFVPRVTGTFGAALALTLAAGMLLGVGGLVLGVALARWLPNPLAPIVAIVLIGLVSPKLGAAATDDMWTVMILSTMPGVSDGAPLPTTGQAALHVVWLVTITAATAAAALVGGRHELEVTGRPGDAVPVRFVEEAAP